jgi:hypothetical protein
MSEPTISDEQYTSITGLDVLDFKVCDGNVTCVCCQSASAPVIIKDHNFCWTCAFELATEFIVHKELIHHKPKATVL